MGHLIHFCLNPRLGRPQRGLAHTRFARQIASSALRAPQTLLQCQYLPLCMDLKCPSPL